MSRIKKNEPVTELWMVTQWGGADHLKKVFKRTLKRAKKWVNDKEGFEVKFKSDKGGGIYISSSTGSDFTYRIEELVRQLEPEN
jgi:hypothetical protein